MEVYGIGTDIIEVERLHPGGKLPSQRFMQRCFTTNEAERLSKRPAEDMAGHFAAKEAVVKAMGTGFTGFWPCDVEVKHNSAGKPEVELHGRAAEIAKKAGIMGFEVSISHCRTLAVAMAVAFK